MYTDKNFEHITVIIQDIQDKALELENSKKIHKIEMDILLEKVRELYDNLKKMDKEISMTSKAHESENTDSKASRTIEFKIGPENQTREKQKKTEPEKPETEPEQTTENKQEEVVQPPREEKQSIQPVTEEWKNAEEVSKAREYGPEIVADKYQNARTFMNESLAKTQNKNDVSSKMQAKPINDLIKAIGVNDKFLFIRELFDGNKEKYHEALQILNELPSMAEAETYLKESFNFDWDNPVFQKFYDLIKRKFM
ncbi:MAG: hypothetical protein R6U04_01685 [Bacteroidales bacterium]